jgi:hypothetical protein
MRAIVSVQTFDEGSQLSLVTSCGARVNQVLKSNSTYQQAIMDEWVEEALNSKRLILEIKPDVARAVLGLVKVGEAHHSSWRLPSPIVDELKHFLEIYDGKRNKNEGSRQLGEAEGTIQKEKVDERRSDGPDQAENGRVPAYHNFATGETLYGEWVGECYEVRLKEWVNKDALRQLLKGCTVTEKPDVWYFTPPASS